MTDPVRKSPVALLLLVSLSMFSTGCASSYLLRANRLSDAPSREFVETSGRAEAEYLGTRSDDDGERFHVLRSTRALDPDGARALEIRVPEGDADEIRAIVEEVDVPEPSVEARPATIVLRVATDPLVFPRVDWKGYPDVFMVEFISVGDRVSEILVRYPVEPEPGSTKQKWKVAWAVVDIDREQRSAITHYARQLGYVVTVPLDIAWFPFQIALHLVHRVAG